MSCYYENTNIKKMKGLLLWKVKAIAVDIVGKRTNFFLGEKRGDVRLVGWSANLVPTKLSQQLFDGLP